MSRVKKIIELSTVRNKGQEWEIEMVTSNNGYAAEYNGWAGKPTILMVG